MAALAPIRASSGRAFRFRDRLPGTAVRFGGDVLGGIVIVGGLWLTLQAASPTMRTVQLALAATVLLALFARRRVPRIAAGAAVLATAAGWWFGVTGDPFVIAGFCVLAAAERTGARRFPWWLLTAGVLALVSILVVSTDGLGDRLHGVLVGAVVLACAWVLGVRTREVSEQIAERVRAQERLRLARDVHDVLSHSLGSIGVRAGVTAHIASASPTQLRSTLQEIETDSRAALVELRSLLTRQRDESEHDALSAPLRALIEDAVRPAARAGIRMDVEVEAAAEQLPVGVRTSLHRVIQEAVTNVIRHAGAAACTVHLRTEVGCAVVEIRDDGRGAELPMVENHGLLGMRERVALLGGTLYAGNHDDGFLVRARLPVQSGRPGALWA